jgi:YgiT-type zinc finger domain-containing protein
MECPHCHGTLKVGKTSYTVNRNRYHLIVDEVPAFICEQCQEALFTEEAVRVVQQMIGTLDERRRELNAIEVSA